MVGAFLVQLLGTVQMMVMICRGALELLTWVWTVWSLEWVGDSDDYAAVADDLSQQLS